MPNFALLNMPGAMLPSRNSKNLAAGKLFQSGFSLQGIKNLAAGKLVQCRFSLQGFLKTLWGSFSRFTKLSLSVSVAGSGIKQRCTSQEVSYKKLQYS